jgi:ABC-type multidrug transport system ATPase subunit
MDKLSVHNLSFRGYCYPKYKTAFETLTNFTYQFSFGKSYFLASEIGHGGWALSWIISGLLEPDEGLILLDSLPFTRQQRRKISWCVRRDQIKRFGLFQNMNLQEQIRHGLRTTPDTYLKSEAEIIERFHLSEGRYKRLLRQFSNEGWRASCAVGLAHGKKLFCFPYVDYPRVIEEHYPFLLKDVIDLLRDSGALVLIPGKWRPAGEELCDEVVEIEGRKHV